MAAAGRVILCTVARRSFAVCDGGSHRGNLRADARTALWMAGNAAGPCRRSLSRHAACRHPRVGCTGDRARRRRLRSGLGDMTKRTTAGLAISSLAFVALAHLAFPSAPALYDSLCATTPYQWLHPTPGSNVPPAQSAAQDFAVIDGT